MTSRGHQEESSFITLRQGQAVALQRLHEQDEPLILINAWDAGSACVVQRLGAAAIATTSAGMAWSLGYPDGERVPRDEFIAACARICRVTRVPVSVDIERGFGCSVGEVVELVDRLMGFGVVGVNIEDGVSPATHTLQSPTEVCERISALRQLADESGVPLFINARTDAYLAPHGAPANPFETALQQARLCAAAGASGIFVPGMNQTDEIARFVRSIDLPLNVYAGFVGALEVQALRAAGVRRISLGCGPLQSAFDLLGRIARDAFEAGRFDAMTAAMTSARL